MKKYNIEISETLQKLISIEAESEKEALKIIKEKYRNEDIILDYNDFKDVKYRSV